MRWNREPEGHESKMLVTSEMREGLARGENPLAVCGQNYSLACFQNVWDDFNRHDNTSTELRTRLTKERGETCFYYPYAPGMFFPAAAELERRQADRHEAQRDRKVGMWGIIIGLVGVVLGALLTRILT